MSHVALLRNPSFCAVSVFYCCADVQTVLMACCVHQPFAGGQGRRCNISPEEVKQHSSVDDAWLVLHGKVYNITPYLRFHPGGADILLKAAGRDATSLFNKYHPWVNAHALLERCCLGTLQQPATTHR